MLEIDCSKLSSDLCNDIFEDVEKELKSNRYDINILPQSQIIIINKDSNYLHGKLIQMVYSSLTKKCIDSSEYTQERINNYVHNGISIRKI